MNCVGTLDASSTFSESEEVDSCSLSVTCEAARVRGTDETEVEGETERREEKIWRDGGSKGDHTKKILI